VTASQVNSPTIEPWLRGTHAEVPAAGRAVLHALDLANEIHGRPVVIIARTTKGKGVSFMENAPQWHGGIPNDHEYRMALDELQEGARQWQV